MAAASSWRFLWTRKHVQIKLNVSIRHTSGIVPVEFNQHIGASNLGKFATQALDLCRELGVDAAWFSVLVVAVARDAMALGLSQCVSYHKDTTQNTRNNVSHNADPTNLIQSTEGVLDASDKLLFVGDLPGLEVLEVLKQHGGEIPARLRTQPSELVDSCKFPSKFTAQSITNLVSSIGTSENDLVGVARSVLMKQGRARSEPVIKSIKCRLEPDLTWRSLQTSPAKAWLRRRVHSPMAPWSQRLARGDKQSCRQQGKLAR